MPVPYQGLRRPHGPTGFYYRRAIIISLLKTRKHSQELDQKFKQVNTLTQSKHRLEMTIVKAGEDLNKAHAVAENRIQELEMISQKLP